MSVPLSAHVPTQVSAAEAARACGLSEKTVRRWIKAGKLRADMANGAYSVDLDEVSALAGRVPAQSTDMGPSTGMDGGADIGTDTSAPDVRPSEVPGTDIMRAEAMAVYTRSILEPVVAALERSEERARELERENGVLTTERDAARADLATVQAAVTSLEAQNATLLASASKQDSEPPTEPGPCPEPFPAPLPPSPNERPWLLPPGPVRAAVVLIVFAAVLILVFWLGH